MKTLRKHQHKCETVKPKEGRTDTHTYIQVKTTDNEIHNLHFPTSMYILYPESTATKRSEVWRYLTFRRVADLECHCTQRYFHYFVIIILPSAFLV